MHLIIVQFHTNIHMYCITLPQNQDGKVETNMSLLSNLVKREDGSGLVKISISWSEVGRYRIEAGECCSKDDDE